MGGSISYILLLYSTRERVPYLGGKFFLRKVWKYGISFVSLWGGGVYKKSVQ